LITESPCRQSAGVWGANVMNVLLALTAVPSAIGYF
jgi:hypothetical protein